MLLGLLCSVLFVITTITNVQGFTVWPMPEQVSTGTFIGLIPNYKSFKFGLNQQVSVSKGDYEIMYEAFARYSEIMFFDQTVDSRTVSCPQSYSNHEVRCIDSASITILEPSKDVAPSPFFEMDESYALSIEDSSSTIQIIAKTVWGALRSLESLSQLVQRREELNGASFEKNFYAFVEYLPIRIKDRPRFPWRGFLLDTSRHFYTLRKIRQIIDSLTYMKMNVFHWHIVDSQSFPMVVQAYPSMSQKGAFHKKAVYTPNDIRAIVDYGRKRGIRVVPEVDMPGHSASWGFGIPNITANCPKVSEKNINNVALNPTNPQTYEVMKAVIDQMMQSGFSDQYYHFGGDELVTDCWLSDPSISSFMKEKGITNPVQLLFLFEDQLRRVYLPLNKTMICWEELALEYGYKVPQDTIVQVWKDRNTLPLVVKKGYQAILSGGWYLDQQIPGNQTFYCEFFIYLTLTLLAWGDTWINFYENDPTEGFGMTEQEKKMVMGGEVCNWSEQVDDANFDSRVFPRTLAVAERLWSPSSVTDIPSATLRMENTRCHIFVRRGIGAGPIIPGFCEATFDNFG